MTYYQQVRDYVVEYNGYLTGQKHPNARQLALDYMLNLIDCHRVMTFVTAIYITSKLLLFQRDIERFSNSASVIDPPSREERLRVLRAFYRLQMSFYVHGVSASVFQRKHNMTDVECINYRFFGLCQPWELEQILCVAGFTTSLSREFTQIYFSKIWRLCFGE